MVMRMISVALLTALCLFLRTASAEGPVIAAPQNVRFHSVNLRNTLHWSPGEDTTPDTTYTVEYAIYGDTLGGTEQVAWRTVEKCRGISDTECNLTEQTDDMYDNYYARVRASGLRGHSHWVETERRFRPLSDTIIGPPRVKVTLVENYMHIELKGPFQWKSSRMKRGRSLWRIFPYMVYNISVYYNRSKHMHFLLENDSRKLGPLDYESEHCVQAEAYSRSLPLSSIQSDWICITVPSDPFTAQMMVLIFGGVIPTAICLFLLAAVGGFAYYYICDHRQKLPTSTDMVHVEETHKTFQPEKPLIINLNLFSTNLSTGDSKLRPLGTLYHGDNENERLLPILALPSGSRGKPEHPPPQGEVIPSYAAQQVELNQDQTGSDITSDTSADFWAGHGFPSDDYGLVLRGPLRQEPQQDVTGLVIPDMFNMSEQPSECKVNLYKAQSREKDPDEKRHEQEEQEEKKENEEEEEEEEEENQERGTLVDWDPRTGVLKIPLLCQFGSENATDTEVKTVTVEETRVDTKLLQHRPVLTSVVIRQSSQESREEDIFTKMEKDWGLQIQSSPE